MNVKTYIRPKVIKSGILDKVYAGIPYKIEYRLTQVGKQFELTVWKVFSKEIKTILQHSESENRIRLTNWFKKSFGKAL